LSSFREKTHIDAIWTGLQQAFEIHRGIWEGRGMSVNSLKSEGIAAAERPERRDASLVCLAAMAASFVIAYAPTYVSLAEGPWQTEQEGHGPIIMLGAAWLSLGSSAESSLG
jgi:hypothetical protein